jgi:hypothetical protein
MPMKRFPFLPLLGLVLLAAGVLKGYAVATADLLPLREVHPWSTDWFSMGLVEMELALGLWLVSGLYARPARWAGVAIFALFFEVSLYQTLMGQPSCGCLGKLTVPPWLMAPFDLAAVFGLLAWPHPGVPSRTIWSHPWRFAGLLVLFVVLGVPGLLAMNRYRPDAGLVNRDLRLWDTLDVIFDRPTQADILDLVQRRTSLKLEVDKSLAARPTIFGAMSFHDAQAGAVMDLVADTQREKAYWEPTEQGYRLTQPPYWRTLNYWWLGGILAAVALAGFGVVYVWVRLAQRRPESRDRLQRESNRANVQNPRMAESSQGDDS